MFSLFPFYAVAEKTSGEVMQYQYNKITNLKLGASRLDGLFAEARRNLQLLASCWKTNAPQGLSGWYGVVPRTHWLRYRRGLCQLTNLIFWMTLHTPLTVIERYRHSHHVFPDSNRTQSFGGGAACADPYRDLMIRNGTNRKFQFRVWVGTKNLEGEWLA